MIHTCVFPSVMVSSAHFAKETRNYGKDPDMPLRAHLMISPDFRDLVLGELWQGIGCGGDYSEEIPAGKTGGGMG